MVFGGETAESYYDEGVTASMKGDVALAIQHFEKALQLDPYYVACHHQLGRCKVRQGEFKQAVECFYRVIKARPNPIPPRLDLGFALLEGGNAKRAAEVFDEVSQVKPDNARAMLGLGACAFAEGDWGRSLALATQALQLGGANFATLYLQARAARLAGRPDVAAEAFDQADALLEKLIEGNPDQPEPYYLRGEICFARLNFVAALQAYQAAESRMADGVHYYSFGEHFELTTLLEKRGMCLLRLERLADARAMGEEIIQRNPRSRVGALLAGSGEAPPEA
jgi:tetratricopeptide (TPR) repeat protein